MLVEQQKLSARRKVVAPMSDVEKQINAALLQVGEGGGLSVRVWGQGGGGPVAHALAAGAGEEGAQSFPCVQDCRRHQYMLTPRTLGPLLTAPQKAAALGIRIGAAPVGTK